MEYIRNISLFDNRSMERAALQSPRNWLNEEAALYTANIVECFRYFIYKYGHLNKPMDNLQTNWSMVK